MQTKKDDLSSLNNYCVYLHKIAYNNEVFYVGSGVQNKREFHFSARSKAWHAIKEKFDITVEVLYKDLTKQEARTIEQSLISSGIYKNLVNTRHVSCEISEMTDSNFNQYVYYDETSSTGLRWKINVGTRGRKGAVAGNLSYDRSHKPKGGYIKLNGTSYVISRVVWVLHNKVLPTDMVIDHINNNSHDNRIENLRCVSIAENSRNRLRNAKSKTNSPGISLIKAAPERNASSRFQATVSINNKVYMKSFSTKKYGFEQAEKMAKSWRAEMLEYANSIGANYTKNHFPDIDTKVDYSHTPHGSSGIKGLWLIKGCDGEVKSVVAKVKKGHGSRLFTFTIGKFTLEDAIDQAKALLAKPSIEPEEFKHRTFVQIYAYDKATYQLVNQYDTVKEASSYYKISKDALYKRFENSDQTEVQDHQGNFVILSKRCPSSNNLENTG
jgi:hypothetical protein